MLVLSVKCDGEDYVRIGDDTWVTVEEIRANGTVKLGFIAPSEVAIHRKRVAEAVDKGHDLQTARAIANGKYQRGQEPAPTLPPRTSDHTEPA
jgi:carbon storage regulator CsrA